MFQPWVRLGAYGQYKTSSGVLPACDTLEQALDAVDAYRRETGCTRTAQVLNKDTNEWHNTRS